MPSASSPSWVEGPSAMMSPFWIDVAHLHQRTLVDAGRLVRALELAQAVDVDARLGRIGFFRRANDDTGGVHLIDDARAARGNGGAGIARHNALPCRCRPAALPAAAAARPGAACSSPSGRGWRRRFPGTEPAPRRPTPSCFGDTSMNSTWSGVVITKLPPLRHDTSSSVMRPRPSIVALAWAIVYFASSIADR